jgi:hypothetical protein
MTWKEFKAWMEKQGVTDKIHVETVDIRGYDFDEKHPPNVHWGRDGRKRTVSVW